MKHLNPILKQFMALSLRERLLAIGAFIGVIYFVFDLTLLQPQQRQAKALREQISTQESELSSFNRVLQALTSANASDPLAKQRAERDALRKTFTEAESLIGNATAEVRLGEIIRAMIAAKPGLALISLKTLPVETFYKPATGPADTAPSGSAPAAWALPTLYKHGVEVAVRGEYVTLMPYLQGLERHSNIYWGNVRLDVGTYPDATLKFTIYTLSARPELPLG
jgi:MSHA biogenesis protein MshJ